MQALRKIPLRTATGSLIQLSDVADVDWSVKDADSIARFNGEDTVTITMTKNQSASTIGMVNDVKKVMKNISEQNENAVIEASYDASDMIFESLKFCWKYTGFGCYPFHDRSVHLSSATGKQVNYRRMLHADLSADDSDCHVDDGIFSEYHDSGWSGDRHRYDGRQFQCRD